MVIHSDVDETGVDTDDDDDDDDAFGVSGNMYSGDVISNIEFCYDDEYINIYYDNHDE